jgi:hypothetical protein
MASTAAVAIILGLHQQEVAETCQRFRLFFNQGHLSVKQPDGRFFGCAENAAQKTSGAKTFMF